MKKLREITKKYLSTTEVAKIMGISRIAVFKKIKTGEIKAERIGRNYAISKEDIPIEDIRIDVSDNVMLSDEKKTEIKKVVKKAVKEYGEAFKLLGKE
jgi:excisionase family DNA binding protein